MYCQYKSLEDVKKEYVRRKIVQLYDKTTCIGQKLELLIQYARKLTDDKSIVSSIPFRTTNLNSTLKTKFKEVNGSIEDERLESVRIEIILQEIFEMDFNKCPVETYILVRNCDTIKAQLIEKFSDALLCAKNNSELLLDLAKVDNFSKSQAQQSDIETPEDQNFYIM